MKPDSLAAAGAVAALGLAAIAQLASRSRGVDAFVIAGYVGASAVFALSASRVGETLDDGVRIDTARRARLLALLGVAAAGVLGFAAHVVVFDSLEAQQSSILGPLLWAASVIVLLATAIFARPLPSWPAAWKPDPWPASRRRRRVLLGVIAALLVVGAATRLVALGSIPLGINADEGDRAASAISLLSGEAPRNLFASGWYYISNVYFWLLAGVMKVLGVGYVQARVLGAVSGWLTLVVVVWIAFRHFGHRMALLTAMLGTALGVMLQFSRETTEAAPTALCWALSTAFLLEAARTGGTWPWVAAGVVGGVSLYFYPSGRLWLVLAALVCSYLVLRAGPVRRWAAVAGAASTALAALVTLGPFLANVRLHPGEFALRARQVSVFSEDNASRLSYYHPDWNRVELVWAQLKHSFGIFASSGDGGGFWPTERPILGPVLTLLVAVGLGWFTLSWRHVPRFTIALWFWLGFVGMVVTVETPNLQRMATAVPVLPLLAAGVLDASAARVRGWTRRVVPEWDAGGLVVTGIVVILAGALAVQQGRFYFDTYADMEGWPQPTIQGRAVADQGPETLVMTLGRQAHQINSGWVRLLAPDVDRGSIPSPGSQLPVAVPPTRDLAFMLYPEQAYYLPFLRDLYPGGSVRAYRSASEGTVVIVYRVPRARVAATHGSIVRAGDALLGRVARLGDVPSGASRGTPLTWSALLHVPQYWNYTLRVGPGPARLSVDGRTVLRVAAGRTRARTVALVRGRHLVMLDGRAGRASPTLEWRVPTAGRQFGPAGFGAWRQVGTSALTAATAARGLVRAVTGVRALEPMRLDSTIATCCVTDDVGGRTPYVAEWRGTLTAPRQGKYVFFVAAQDLATLRIDGRTVVRTAPLSERQTAAEVKLRKGPHDVVLRYRVSTGPGAVEVRWTPPGGRYSVIPASALQPPAGAGLGTALPVALLAPAGVPLPADGPPPAVR